MNQPLDDNELPSSLDNRVTVEVNEQEPEEKPLKKTRGLPLPPIDETIALGEITQLTHEDVSSIFNATEVAVDVSEPPHDSRDPELIAKAGEAAKLRRELASLRSKFNEQVKTITRMKAAYNALASSTVKPVVNQSFSRLVDGKNLTCCTAYLNLRLCHFFLCIFICRRRNQWCFPPWLTMWSCWPGAVHHVSGRCEQQPGEWCKLSSGTDRPWITSHVG